MSCKSCKFPSVIDQAKNVTLSLFNVVTQAYKTGEVMADQATIEKRISTCEGCPFFKESRCTECGCFIALKSGLKSESCPKGKW